MRANDLSKFTFEFGRWGYGHYLVTYTTNRGDYYKALVTDMSLIDATKNAEHAKIRILRHCALSLYVSVRITIRIIHVSKN